MTSKAFFKSSIAPKLVQRVDMGRKAVEVWTTTCIVSNFGEKTDANCSILINPSNPELSGVSNFPYFPKGGPVPRDKPRSMHKDWQPLGFVSTWGGMEVGTGMMFPVSVVDGLVHQMGGWKLQAECAWLRLTKTEPCPIGSAVATTAGNDRLAAHYRSVIHTTPPFYDHSDSPKVSLRQCYKSATELAFADSSIARVAVPLLGSGARGFPMAVAIDVAAEASVEWARCVNDSMDDGVIGEKTLVFGLLEDSYAEQLLEHIERLRT
ncbi:predicted protein [Phaeodactylum tricornutum CCAP 1055/1]|jgi:O-acetyl-ADP-ribose deacetylase (regulator of RNase III)|uniref:Macro domain-containing protein n=2 Tax=Phaeodactylum tricornutum TaxID=2850 RepID=B7G1F3_PHATC|nr:predicted protein [Phaeodactylum tricornutum CCAP 1055/1]EEC47674.1 predicted protein [Phaeodactylum tricornutum CCAP 1055/1]|eukprot:XP_002181022.1 predicted protein [Phaeodactylum tricornutum CCAP 1055/1]